MNKEVLLSDLQPMIHVQESKTQSDTGNSHDSAITESDTLSSHVSGHERSSSLISKRAGDKPYVVTRSGRISKPSERLEYLDKWTIKQLVQLSSHLFFFLSPFLAPFTVPCKIVSP